MQLVCICSIVAPLGSELFSQNLIILTVGLWTELSLWNKFIRVLHNLIILIIMVTYYIYWEGYRPKYTFQFPCCRI